MIDSLFPNLRYGARTLRRSPVFAAAVILTLALGIGANTAIFSVVNAVLLRPLPYQDSDRFVRPYENLPAPTTPGAWPRRLPGIAVREAEDIVSRLHAMHGVFARTEKQRAGGIWLMSASGTDLRPLIHDAVNDYYPRWFADGRRVLIERDVPGKEGDIWVVNVELRTARQLTSHPALDGASTVSPDGTNIAFPSERNGQRNIWIMPLAEGEAGAWQFTADGGRGPAWSPDGRWIAYGCPVASTQYALCLKTVAGGPVRQVTDGKANDFNPSWTPDGKSIVVSRISGLAVIDLTAVVT